MKDQTLDLKKRNTKQNPKGQTNWTGLAQKRDRERKGGLEGTNGGSSTNIRDAGAEKGNNVQKRGKEGWWGSSDSKKQGTSKRGSWLKRGKGRMKTGRKNPTIV
jgi:hypothetical protein